MVMTAHVASYSDPEEHNAKHSPPDMVNNPKHYVFGSYEVKNIISCWVRHNEKYMTHLMAHYWATLIPYLFRFTQKNGVEDLRKARVYLDLLIDEAVLNPKKETYNGSN